MKTKSDRMNQQEWTAWQSFEQTGEIGAYLLFCAMREERRRLDL